MKKSKAYSRGSEVLAGLLLFLFAMYVLYETFLQFLFRGMPLRFLFQSFGRGQLVAMLITAVDTVLIGAMMLAKKKDVIAVIGTALVALSVPIQVLPQFFFLSHTPLILLGKILVFLADAAIVLMTCSAIFKKPSLPLEKLSRFPALVALAGVVLSLVAQVSLEGTSFFAVFRHVGYMSSFLSVFVCSFVPGWLLSDIFQARDAAEASAADRNKQVEFYRDLMLKGAITPEEFEEKRRKIEGE